VSRPREREPPRERANASEPFAHFRKNLPDVFTHTHNACYRVACTREKFTSAQERENERERERAVDASLYSAGRRKGGRSIGRTLVRPDRTSRTSVQGEGRASRQARTRVNKPRRKNIKLPSWTTPAFRTEPRVLESYSVNPSWIVIERCQGAIDALREWERQRFMYLDGSHSFVAPPRAVEPFDEP